jgi:hypothetical protein
VPWVSLELHKRDIKNNLIASLIISGCFPIPIIQPMITVIEAVIPRTACEVAIERL